MNTRYARFILSSLGLCVVCFCGCQENTTKDSVLADDSKNADCDSSLLPRCEDNNTLVACKNGMIVEILCDEENKICSGEIPECRFECTDADDNRCDGNMAVRCDNNHLVKEICGDNQFCDQGACKQAECTDADENRCDGNMAVRCDNNHFVKEICGDNQFCDQGACKQAECADDSIVCNEDTDIITICRNHQLSEIRCREDNKICTAEADGCIFECTPESYPDQCISETERTACIDGHIAAEDCSKQGDAFICRNGACKDSRCALNYTDCDTRTNQITRCESSQFPQIIDCTFENKICRVGSEQCEFECSSSLAPSCLNALTRRSCDNHHLLDEVCGGGMICKFGECIPDPCLECTAEEACIDYKCVSEVSISNVGEPCRCEGKNCTITISGAEIKSMLSTAGNIALRLIGLDIDQISNNENITMTNYFAGDSIIGCEKLAKDIPPGMTLGCARDTNISFPPSLIGFVQSIPEAINLENAGSFIDLIPERIVSAILNYTPRIVKLMQSGVDLPIQDGYCMTAAINVDLQWTALVGMLIYKQNFDRQIAKITTGDHSIAQDDASVCPPGSSKYVYNASRSISQVGTGTAGIDICLKNCIVRDDCREGFDCLDIPTGLPAQGQSFDDMPVQKACFDEKMLDLMIRAVERIGLSQNAYGEKNETVPELP